ncbi:MAG: aminoacetone oxidase family FAD-binding enzyme, partial [Candidatus Absconditabacterales bacterium]
KGDRFVLTGTTQTYVVDKLILATGGNAYRHTGSEGDGYAFAQSLGHTVTALGPSLNSFQTSHERMHALSGISFPQSALIAKDGKSFVGPLLLTHFGITGPVVFAFSAYTSFESMETNHPLLVKRKPDHEQSYDYRLRILQEAKSTQAKKQLGSILKTHFPDRFVQGLCAHYGFGYDMPMASLHQESMKATAHILGNGLELQLIARRAGDEFVTAGGVPAHEIDHRTMQSLICPDLYIVGELLDVDGVTGGYNLTSSWASGRLAGSHIAQSILQ